MSVVDHNAIKGILFLKASLIFLNFEKPIKQGPNKCPVYLRLSYLGREAIALESNVKNIVNSTFRSVQLGISYFTRKPLNGICKDTTADHEKTMLFINLNATATVCMSVEHPKDSILDVTSMLQNP